VLQVSKSDFEVIFKHELIIFKDLFFVFLRGIKKKNFMDKIVIEIDNPTAEKFKKLSPETQSRFGETISIALKKIINEATGESHKRFLDEISNEAQKKGLLKKSLTNC
jgi:hypothetical protein